MKGMTPGRSKVVGGRSPNTLRSSHTEPLSLLGSFALLIAPSQSHSVKLNKWFYTSCSWSCIIIIKYFYEFVYEEGRSGQHRVWRDFCPLLPFWGVHSSGDRGQRSGWPSPLGIISPVLIWLSETSASLANLIPEPGGRLGQITFLLRTDWTYGEINAPSRHSERGDCLRQLCPYCVTQWGTQLVYEDIIVLQVVQILIMYRNVFLLAVEWKQYCKKDVVQIPRPLLASEGCC